MAAAAPRRLLSAAQLADYDRDGFVKCDNWVAPDEVAQLLEIAKADKAFTDAARDLEDDEGNISRLSLRMWELPEDSYSAFVRHEALVHPMEQLLGGDTGVYHYHHKMMLKEPRTGGAWEWQCVLLMPPSSCLLTRCWPAG
jgi:ectoine hydroxylase